MTLTTLAEVLALLNDAKKISAATATTILPQTASYPVAVVGDTTARRITHATLRGGVFNVRDYGAVGDDSHDDKAAIDAAKTAALAAGGTLYFPPGTYAYSGKITLTSVQSESWLGCGSALSIIHFTDSTVSALVERLQKNSKQFSVKGLTFKGPGKAAGTNVHGFYSSYMTGAVQNSYSYNLRMDDVAVTDVSGTAFYVTDWFQQAWYGCYAREVHGDGFVLSGDQSTTFISSGCFNLNIDGWSWWFQGGNPFLQGLNCGNVGNGIKFGRGVAHSAGPSYCFPTILGCNIEPCLAGGTGFYWDTGSGLAFGSGLQVYATGAVVAIGAKFEYLSNGSILANPIQFIDGGGGFFTIKLTLTGTGGLIVLGPSMDADNTAAGKLVTANLLVNNGYLVSDRKIKANGLYLNGIVESKVRTVTASTTIYRDSGTLDDYILFCDSASQLITVNIDYPSYLPNRTFIIKRIGSPGNDVTIVPNGGTIDGATTYVLTAAYKFVELFSDGTNWYVLRSN